MTQLTINRNYTDRDCLTHIADDVQMYAELLRGIGYTREDLEANFRHDDVELFDDLLVYNRFNTTIEYSKFSGDTMSNCMQKQRRLANRLRQVFTSKISMSFVQRAGIECDRYTFMDIRTEEVLEYVQEYEIDKCETMKFYAESLVSALVKPSDSLIKRKRTFDDSRIDKIQMYLEIALNELRVPMYKLNFCGLRGIGKDMVQLTIFENKYNTDEELAEYYGVSKPLIERRWMPILRAVRDCTAYVLAERFREKVDLPKYVKDYNVNFGMHLEGSSYTSYYAEQLCGDYLKMHVEGKAESMRDIVSHLNLQLESE